MKIKWTTINSLGQSNIVRSNYIWIFLIPILVKNIQNINMVLGVDIQLPFSISKLFYASLFFSIGTLIYQLRCPLIIKENRNLTDFKHEGKKSQHIVDYFSESKNKFISGLDYEYLKKTCRSYDKCTELEDKDTVEIDDCWVYIDKNTNMDFFWSIFNYLNNSFCYSSLLTAIFYGLGILFLSITTVENVFFMLKYFWFT